MNGLRASSGGNFMRLPGLLDSEQRNRQSRLTAILADAAIATSASLESVLATLYRFEPDLLAHVSRVARLSAHIGRDLKLTERAIEDVERAALVHDFGRLVMRVDVGSGNVARSLDVDQPPEQILACAAIVSSVPFLGRAADIVLASRECLDGSGLPFGLKDAAISLEARILHVADIFDTASVLCGMFGIHPAAAHIELVKHSGSKFDADVVAACLRCCESVRPMTDFHNAERRI